MKYCLDCGKELKGNGNPTRCKSCSGKANWRNPEFRQKMVGHYNDPEVRKQRSESGKIRYSNPDNRLKTSQAMLKPEVRKRLSDIKKAQYAADPSMGKAMGERAKAMWQDEKMRSRLVNNAELRKGRSERAKQQWNETDSLIRLVVQQGHAEGKYESAIKAMHSPEVRAKAAMAMKLAWQNPDLRIRQAMRIRSSKVVASALEKLVTNYLLGLGLDVITQFRPDNFYRFYDISIPELKFIIEVDGDFWHHSEWAIARGQELIDDIKNVWALSNGYSVLRLRECDLEKSGVDVHTEDGLVTYLNCNIKPVLLRYNGCWSVEPADEVVYPRKEVLYMSSTYSTYHPQPN